MTNEINERWVSFSGKFLVPEEIDRSKYLMVSGEFEHGDLVQKNNQDGTIDVIYKIMPIRVMFQAGDTKLRGKVKGRASQRLRMALWHTYQAQNGKEEFFQDWYESFISKIIADLPTVQNVIGIEVNHE